MRARYLLIMAFGITTVGIQWWPRLNQQLIFDRTHFEHGAYWLLISAQWAHLGIWHALGNAMAFGLLLYMGRSWVPLSHQMLALAGGYAGVAMVLILDTGCTYYAGASGALHGLFAGMALLLGFGGATKNKSSSFHYKTQTTRYLAFGLLVALGIKLIAQAQQSEGLPALGWSFPIYTPAHIAGAAGGSVATLVHFLRQYFADTSKYRR